MKPDLPANVDPFDPETITARILADHLRTMIAKAGTTPARLAKRLGVSTRTIELWCKGENIGGCVTTLAAFEVMGCRVLILPPGRPKRTVRMGR